MIAKGCDQIASQHGHGVWVPAFAGTTVIVDSRGGVMASCQPLRNLGFNCQTARAQAFAVPRHELPGLCRRTALKKREGAGNAGRWPRPWPACEKKCRRQVPQVRPKTPGIPRAMVLTLIRGLLGAPGFLATVSRQRVCTRCARHQRRDARTARFHVRRPAFVCRAPNVHRIPAPRVVTIARNAPLNEAGWRHTTMISDKKKALFFAKGPNGTNRVERICENSFCAHADFAGDEAVLQGRRTDHSVSRRSEGAHPVP